ncbi:MAG: DUF3570 domain-containing protein [Granulosicoccus sp.]|nr:DUF3570 domain-containing protein [Granulosicoccus sp.]
MSSLRQGLSVAVCTLLASGAPPAARAAVTPWEVDTSYLSYQEANDRVTVSKTLANLTRSSDTGAVTVGLVHDTMSGASPTGAIRSSDSVATYTSASGSSGFSAGNGGDYSLSTFDDTRIQAGLDIERELSRRTTLSYGGAVSNESDYESMGVNVGLARETGDRLTTFESGLAFTTDTIYRSASGDTPEPMSNMQQQRPYSEGKRNTVDALLGVSRVLNRQTVAQLNLSVGVSRGYHSDPYKIISAADDDDRILANFHDSRPDARLRTSLYGKLVHQLQNSEHSLHLSYRLYQDDWAIQSHTADLRYRHQLGKRHYLEPHVRLYRQSKAEFYQRKLAVDEGLNPIMPDDGFASADYRLDAMTSSTLGLKYGLKVTPDIDLRLRAEFLDQNFSTAEYSRNSALILQSSVKVRF